MKNKELKKFESVAFIMLEVLAKAVEMKKLQLEEKKLNIDRELWIEQRSGQKVGSSFPSGEKYPKYQEGGMIYHGSDFNMSGHKSKEVDSIWSKERIETFSSIASQIEEGIRAGSIVPIKFENGILDCLGKLPKDIHEEALENGLKSEKKCQTAFDLIDKVSPVGEPKKTNVDFQFPKRNFGIFSPAENYFFVDRNKWKLFFGDNEKELFCFEDRDSRKIITLKTRDEVEFAIAQNLEIYFRWVRR